MTFVRYKLESEKLELFYAAYKRVFDSIHPNHQYEFHSIFHLYQGDRKYDKEHWITWYVDYAQTNRWETEDLTNDIEVMVDCLGYDLKYVQISPDEMGYVCLLRPYQHLDYFFICRPCCQIISKTTSFCPRLLRRHQLLRRQRRHKFCRPCRPYCQSTLEATSICPQLLRRHQLLRRQSRHKNGIHYGKFLSK